MRNRRLFVRLRVQSAVRVWYSMRGPTPSGDWPAMGRSIIAAFVVGHWSQMSPALAPPAPCQWNPLFLPNAASWRGRCARADARAPRHKPRHTRRPIHPPLRPFDYAQSIRPCFIAPSAQPVLPTPFSQLPAFFELGRLPAPDYNGGGFGSKWVNTPARIGVVGRKPPFPTEHSFGFPILAFLWDHARPPPCAPFTAAHQW